MRTIKIYLFLFGAFCSWQASGQVFRGNDTIVIGEVVIRAGIAETKLPGFKVSKLDSALLHEFTLNSIADMLSASSSVFIKSYGSGGSATPSLRGTGAGNTRVTWNGIKLDNPMLGQPDLSLLPSGFTDDVSISYGGASLVNGSGTAGGNISFETGADWDNPSSVSLASGVASFGHYSGFVSAKTGNGNYRFVTKGFFQSAENDFPFTNNVYGPEPFTEKRRNSQVLQYGLMQEIYYRTPSDLFSARVWYQKATRSLPSSVLLLQTTNTENQDDESLRMIFGYDHETQNGNLFMTGALVTDRLDYFNRVASIESENLSSTITVRGGIRGLGIIGNLETDLIFSEELNSVKSNNYNSRSSRNSADLTVLIRNKGNSPVKGTFLAREILHMNKFLLPDFSAGISFRPLEFRDYFLKASLARSSRIPTLNDLYWTPGGNRDLQNEYAWMFELGYEVSHKIGPELAISSDLSLFRNSIKDMIQWRPGESGWWVAQNIGHVNTCGLEASLSLKYTNGRFSSMVNCSYSYTSARDAGDSEGHIRRQLVYVPENQFNSYLRIKYRSMVARWSTSGNSLRYTVPDNTKYLPGFSVSDAMIGTTINKRMGSMELDFEIGNILNKEYETIAYYPLPGRTFNLKLMFQIKSAK